MRHKNQQTKESRRKGGICTCMATEKERYSFTAVYSKEP